jgi:hypothetical protein
VKDTDTKPWLVRLVSFLAVSAHVFRHSRTLNLMSYIMVDIESDGPIPGTEDYSMICFGAVIVDDTLSKTFYGKLRPISSKWVPEALAVSGFTREETLRFPEAKLTMCEFESWLATHNQDRPMFISDNNGFDYSFINWYFHHFLGRNPFGHSSTNLGSLYKGIVRDLRRNFKHLRRTVHDHNPVNDAKGNAEAFRHVLNEYGMKI